MKPFRPMKAVDVKEPDELGFPLLAQLKVDGVYALVRNRELLGRSLKPFKNEFISETLSSEKFEGFVGELVHTPKGSFVEMNREDACRSTTSCVNTIKKDWEWTWVLFDYVHPDYIELPYSERMTHLSETVLPELLASEQLPIIDIGNFSDKVFGGFSITNSGEEVEHFYQKSLDMGYEGLILRCPQGKWKNGRSTLREQLLMRMKPQSDKEAVVIGVVEAMQNNNPETINELGYTERSSHQENKTGKGIVGSLLAIDVETGMQITIGAGKLDHSERAVLLDNPPIGWIAKYRSMDTGVKNLPRFPRFMEWRAIEDMDDKLVGKVEEIIKEYC